MVSKGCAQMPVCARASGIEDEPTDARRRRQGSSRS